MAEVRLVVLLASKVPEQLAPDRISAVIVWSVLLKLLVENVRRMRISPVLLVGVTLTVPSDVDVPRRVVSPIAVEAN